MSGEPSIRFAWKRTNIFIPILPLAPLSATGAVSGGKNLLPSGGVDPISIGTVWLYYSFAEGTLQGYNYGTGLTTSAVALQNTIWWLKGEATDLGIGNIFRNAVLLEYRSADKAMKDNNETIPVAVLNLWA